MFFIILGVCISSLAQSSAKVELVVRADGSRTTTSYSISVMDQINIKASAERVVKGFESLLNGISTGVDLEPIEMSRIINDSYSAMGQRVFLDSTALVQDDIRDAQANKSAKEKMIRNYLIDFDLLYKKSSETSVVFSNLLVSNVKKGNYYYVKVFYECLFRNRIQRSNEAYLIKKRMAECKIEKVQNKWRAYITEVRFSDPAERVTDSTNDVVLVPFNDHDVEKRLSTNTNTGSELDATHSYFKDALASEDTRNYAEALRNYQLALTNNPTERSRLTLKINQLSLRKKNLDEGEKKYNQGEYKEAITEYDKAIATDSRFADYYFERGKCFERLKDYKRALKEYNIALQIDNYFPEVYKARAALQEIQQEYSAAIADYTTYASMNNKEVYLYHKIAFLHIAMQNFSAALPYLDTAISISAMPAQLFDVKGQILYKLQKIKEASFQFDKSIALDSTNAAAFFYRGLCRIGSNDVNSAAADFQKARGLKLDSASVSRLTQLADEYFNAALIKHQEGDLNEAISKISSAILIDPYNEKFLIQKAKFLSNSRRVE